MDAAAALISDNIDRITKFDSDLYTDDLVNGEVAVSHGYSGNFFTAFATTDNPERYAYVIPEEGATLWTDNMAIPAGAEHPCTGPRLHQLPARRRTGGSVDQLELLRQPQRGLRRVHPPRGPRRPHHLPAAGRP